MRPLEPYTFFIDRSLGTKDVPNAMRPGLLDGETLQIHDELFAQDAIDQAWLSRVGSARWVALSKDDAIRRRPAEVAALLAAKTAIFIFGGGNVRGADLGMAFLIALPRIRKAVKRFEPGLIGRINKAGEVSVIWGNGEQLKRVIQIR